MAAELMTKREMLSEFNTEYATRQSALEADLEALHMKLDEAIAEEEAETLAIAEVEEKLGEMALEKDLEHIEEAQTALDTKFKTYKVMVDANDKKAAAVVNKIRETQPLIEDIKKTMDEIGGSISSIQETIESLRSKPKVTPTPS